MASDRKSARSLNNNQSDAKTGKNIFSVVMPVFNRADIIVESLESISAQQFRDFETIVVDDGSSDRTVDIIKEKFPWVKIIEQENAGPGSARNRGVKEADGEYIAFLDSDDVWFPWTLKTYAEVISEFNQPAFVAGKQKCFSAEQELASVKQSILKCRLFEDYYSTGQEWLWFGVSSFVIRRDIFLDVGGFAEGRLNGEDAELAMRLGTAPGFVHIANPLQFGYRVHSGNVTLDTEKSRQGLDLLIAGEKEGRFPGGPGRESQRATIISRHVRPFAVQCAREGKLGLAIRYYLCSFYEAVKHFRYRFLIGLPLIALSGWVKNIFRRKNAAC